MSTRRDIIDGRSAFRENRGLISTEVLGWIDLGHAQGTDITSLLMRINAGESSGQEFYDIEYSQSMRDRSNMLKMGKFIRWRIKRGRQYHQRKSIALAMMMSLSLKFEGLQGSFPISMVTDSGFSGEDLVSNLLGFYRVVSLQNPFETLRAVNLEEALKRWDYYGKIGSWKNQGFTPLLFPDPEKFRNARPHKGMLPNFMKTVIPWNDFNSGLVIVFSADGSYMDKAAGGTVPYA